MNHSELRKPLEDFITSVENTLAYLEDLDKQAEGFDKVVDLHDEQYGVIEDAERTIANLLGQRENLKGRYAEAMFEGDAAEQQKILKERKRIDTEVEKLEKTIAAAKKKVENNPLDRVGIAKMNGSLRHLEAPPLSSGLAQHYRKVELAISEAKQKVMEKAHRYRKYEDAGTYREMIKETYATRWF